MTLKELEHEEKYCYSLEEDTLQKLAMAKTDNEKKFLKSHLCDIRGRQADIRNLTLMNLKTEK